MNIALILIILLVGSIATYLSGNRLARITALLFAVASTVFSIATYFKYGVTGWDNKYLWIQDPEIYFSLNVDGLSIAMLLLTTILLPIILLTATSHVYNREKLFYSLVMFMAFAMVGAFLSSNAILYYVFWEMSLIPIYFIVVLWGNGELENRRKAAMTFFMHTFAGSLFMLAAIIYLYTQCGSFQLEAFYAHAANLSTTEQVWIFLAFFLAYAIKIPIFPFHTWQADIYKRAPAVGTMLLAGLMSKMGAYSILRWQIPVAPEGAEILRPYVLILCIIGVIYGAFIALQQDDLKRFMAFGSLSHVGFVAAGAYALTFDGVQGSIILILAHGFAIVGLFYAVELIRSRTEKTKISQLGGILHKAPKFALAFFLLVLAAISMPISFNFVGEFTIMLGLYQVNVWYAVVIGLSLIFGAFIFLRMYQHTMLGKETNEEFSDLSIKEGFVFVAIVAVLILFGVYAAPVSDLVEPAVNEILANIK